LLIVEKEIVWCERLTTTGVTFSMFVNSRKHQAIYLLLTNMLDVTPVVVSLSHKAISLSTINKHTGCDTSCCQSFTPGLLIVDKEIAWCERLTTTGVTSSMFVNSR
jgi:hypothetical protein